MKLTDNLPESPRSPLPPGKPGGQKPQSSPLQPESQKSYHKSLSPQYFCTKTYKKLDYSVPLSPLTPGKPS